MVDSVRAWHPAVPSVREVLHATFEQHAYPAHTHDDWTVLLIDDGAVAYDLDRAAHHATPASITLLPPGVPHDGRSAIDGKGFRKRVLYLEPDWLPAPAPDAAATRPTIISPGSITAVRHLHAVLRSPVEVMAAEHQVLVLRQHVLTHLGTASTSRRDTPLARRLRELLDDRLLETFTLAEAARQLGAHPSHLVRVFSQSYGIAPHRYVTGRRVDRARRLLLGGLPPAEAAVHAGFHDQAHLTRHFRRILGTTPGVFAP
ncbi:helix-turn-helix transcriptional regulator [Agromyces subbeticus]|uniref:helix-turn-helix transcriptional regulator n=1 Tax=Agromyces subbeticus TaxID=293890 RepID=UPI0003B5BBF1|nr:AraC family transcriptional regulator [Agromyces subbeticus]